MKKLPVNIVKLKMLKFVSSFCSIKTKKDSRVHL